MRSPWNQVFDTMQQQLASRPALVCFQVARKQYQALSVFPGPEETVAALHSRKLRTVACDAVIRECLYCVRDSGLRAMAEPLLWTALRPGLTAILGRMKARGATEDDVVSAIQFAVTRQLQSFNLKLARPLCASVLMAIETDVRRELAAERKRQLRQAEFDTSSSETLDKPSASWLGIEPTDDPSVQVEAIRVRLAPLLGSMDADLVIRVHLLDESARAAAEAHGLSYEAARKRVQRAMAHLLQEFSKMDVPFGRTT